VVHLGFQHGLEDDLAGFLRGEGLEGSLGLPKPTGSRLAQVLEFAVEAAGETRQGDIQGVERPCPALRCPLPPPANPGARALPAPPMGTRSKVTPSLWMDSTKSMKAGVPMTETVSGCSLPKYMRRKPAPQRLLGQDVALGRIGAQADDDGDVRTSQPSLSISTETMAL
jgi:hypothetical protein